MPERIFPIQPSLVPHVCPAQADDASHASTRADAERDEDQGDQHPGMNRCIVFHDYSP